MPNADPRKRRAFLIIIAVLSAAYAGYHLPERHPHDVVGPWIDAIGAGALCLGVALAVRFLLVRFWR